MNIHIQNCSRWLINLHSKQNGGDDCEQTNSCEIFLANLMNINCCIVALLFYVHGKQLRSCRDGQLT